MQASDLVSGHCGSREQETLQCWDQFRRFSNIIQSNDDGHVKSAWVKGAERVMRRPKLVDGAGREIDVAPCRCDFPGLTRIHHRIACECSSVGKGRDPGWCQIFAEEHGSGVNSGENCLYSCRSFAHCTQRRAPVASQTRSGLSAHQHGRSQRLSEGIASVLKPSSRIL